MDLVLIKLSASFLRLLFSFVSAL